MKIAYFSPSFPPILGGMGTACYYTANEIGKSHEVTVFLRARRSFSGGEGDNNTEYQKGNYKIKLFKPWFSYGYADFVPQILWKLKNFDVVHLYYPYFGVAEFLMLRSMLRSKPAHNATHSVAGGPKIVFHHAMETVGTGIVKIIANWHKKFIMPILMKKADMIFVLSKDYAENSDITKIYKKYPEKFREVPHGVNINKFKVENSKLKVDNFIIFTAQALDRQHFFKGIDILIKSIHLLITHYSLPARNASHSVAGGPITLLIAGDGHLKNYYENLAQRLSVADKIKFLGKISHDKLPEYYSMADITAIPSTARTECFSITAVESMACGTPVIVSDWPGVRVTIENNKSGLIIKPHDEKGLAEKIKYLYDNPEILKKMGENARTRVEEKYDWEKISNQVINYYKELLK